MITDEMVGLAWSAWNKEALSAPHEDVPERRTRCMRAALEAALSALEPQERDGWKPIETAPKDGSNILAYAEHPSRMFYGVAQWAEADPDFQKTVSGWFWPFAIRPTHWMPLPAAPPHTEGK